MSTGNGRFDFSASKNIHVLYETAVNLDECLLADTHFQKVTVYGYVRIYSNSTTPYIDAVEIIF